MMRTAKMKVTEKDLIGDIKDFPIEVVQKMVDEQVRQGNPADVSIFQKQRGRNRLRGGFGWDRTEEGRDFWEEVIVFKNFDLFFDKYPKEHEDDFWIDPKGRKMLVWNHCEEDAIELVVIAKLPKNASLPYVCVQHSFEKHFKKGEKYYIVSYKNAKPIPAKEEPVELTLDQIAEKFGVSVDRLKIKK